MNLLRAASWISILTLASRVTGLIREQLIAAAFGASASTDAYNVAFRIPNLLRRLFAEGAFSQAFVPLLAQTRARDGDEKTRALTDAVAIVLTWALVLTVLAGIVGAPLIVWLMASGLKEHGVEGEAILMTRIMFPYIGCMSLVALAGGILNTWKRFTVPAATPVLLNVASIAASLFLAPVLREQGINPIYAMAVGVMVGGVLQLALQIPALMRIGMLPRLSFRWTRLRQAWAHDGVHRILKQMAPALLGVSVQQVSLLINTQIASHQQAGAVSWLTYADRLMEFPTALLGVALGVVLLPQLSATQAKGETDNYAALLDWGLRLVLLLALPCAVALLVFAQPLVAVLYHYGTFSAESVVQTANALMGYGAGLMGLVGVKVLAPGFYAKQDLRTPVKIALLVLAVTQGLNLVFVPYLGHAGLALAIGLGAMVNAGCLLIMLYRQGSYRPQPGWGRFGLQIGLATLVLGTGLVVSANAIDWVSGFLSKWHRISALAATLVGVGLAYFATLWALGLRFKDFSRRA